jgi:hypothetical protein
MQAHAGGEPSGQARGEKQNPDWMLAEFEGESVRTHRGFVALAWDGARAGAGTRASSPSVSTEFAQAAVDPSVA